MTRKYTKINKKRISNKKNSKRSKRINNKSKKLSKKIQKGGDDIKLVVDNDIRKSLESLGQFTPAGIFGKPNIVKYYDKYLPSYNSYVGLRCNLEIKDKCNKHKSTYETNLTTLRSIFFNSILHVLKKIHKQHYKKIDKTDIDNLRAIVKFFFQEGFESGDHNIIKIYKFIFGDFDMDMGFANLKLENNTNIFYDNLKNSVDYKYQSNPNNGHLQQYKEYTNLKNKLSECQNKVKNTIYIIDKRIIKEFVKSLYKIIDNKINNLTSSSTTSTTPTTSTATPQQPPNP